MAHIHKFDQFLNESFNGKELEDKAKNLWKFATIAEREALCKSEKQANSNWDDLSDTISWIKKNPGHGRLQESTSDIESKIEALEDVIDKKTEEFDKKWFTEENLQKLKSKSAESGFDDYNKKKSEYVGKKNLEDLKKLRTELRMTKEPKLTSIPKFGDLMSLDDFIESVKSGGFIDYDGYGNYVKDGKMTDIEIYPSDVKNGNIRKEFDKIVWFNR